MPGRYCAPGFRGSFRILLGVSLLVLILVACAKKEETTVSPSHPSPSSPVSVPSLPSFWPPPDASTHQKIPRHLLVDKGTRQPTMGSVAVRVERALDNTGYSSPGYYAVPGGFAMLTQLERINPDATPFESKHRWEVKVSPASLVSFNLEAYLKALLGKDVGLFRVIAFVFTAEPIVTSGVKPSMDEAKFWVGQGGTTLPASFATQPYSDNIVATALVYEFEIPARDAMARQLKPSGHNGQQHLKATRILQALGG